MRWLDSITNSTDMNLSTLGGGGRQRSLVRCSPWGHKESDMTEQLNNNYIYIFIYLFTYFYFFHPAAILAQSSLKAQELEF